MPRIEDLYPIRLNGARGRFGPIAAAASIGLGAWSVPALAQAPVVSQPVVQALPGGDSLSLNSALARLARDPRDVAALIDAGNAALAMGDVEAATGFFRRASQVAPGNPRVKAGLAGALVRSGDPFGAIPLFDEAARAGAIDAALLGDYGLAYDLVGDNEMAQRYYRQALARAANDEVTRRLALSLAIAGDRQGAETTLSPLLQRRDQSAWRTRAFALAILGQTDEAVSIAGSVLPREIADGIAPYLRYMPRLTDAQQAAAANFGAFPRASEIGRDDPRVAAYVRNPVSGARTASADAALVPRGQPLGRDARSRSRPSSTRRQDRAARVAPPEPQPARQSESAALAAAPAPAPVARAQVAAAAPPPPPSQAVVAARAPVPAAPSANAPPAPAVRATSASSAPVPPSSASLMGPPAGGPVPTQPTAPAAPSPASAAAVAPTPRPITLADAFRDFTLPSTEAVPAAGAVDIRSITPARPKVEKPAAAKAAPPKPAPPSHPSRIWVQVATGRDKAALAFDWRRMVRQSAEPFRGKQPFVSAWGQTNRLLTGPFETEAAANAYIAQLRRAGLNGPFVWTSPAGQVVDAIAGGEPAAARAPQRQSQQAAKKKR